MPRRIIFDEVKIRFELSGYKLLETTYQNNKTKMKYVCSKHPKITQTTTYQVLLKCEKTCAVCCNKLNYIDDIKMEFEKRGYRLLDDFYINNKTKMNFICLKHDFETQEITHNQLSRNRGCKYCGREKASEKKRTPFEVIKKAFSDRGYDLIDNFFVNVDTPLRYTCQNHKNKETSLRYKDLLKGVGCKFCAIENATGENHFAWKGGTRELNFYLRGKMKGWKKESLSNFGYKCVVAGTNKDLVIHHIKPFHQLRDEMFKELNIPIYKTVGEYTQDKLDCMVEVMKEKHRNVLGVPMERDIHTLFHKKYGYKTDLDDFKQFKTRYLNRCIS